MSRGITIVLNCVLGIRTGCGTRWPSLPCSRFKIRAPKSAETHQFLSGQDLQQFDEHASVPQVHVEVGDPTGDSGQVGVHPLGEGLLLHRLTLIWGETRGSVSFEVMTKKGKT